MWQYFMPSFLDAVPFVRRLWRHKMEQGLEVTFHNPSYNLPFYGARIRSGGEEDKPICYVIVAPSNPSILAWVACEFINHRNDRKGLVLGASLHLKRKRLLFWSRTLAKAGFLIHSSEGPGRDPRLNIEIPPMSSPVIVGLRAEGPIEYPLSKLPRRMTLDVEFKMVGPLRRVVRRLSRINHAP